MSGTRESDAKLIDSVWDLVAAPKRRVVAAGSHGLGDSAELAASALKRSEVDLNAGLLQVSRKKNGTPSVHPLRSPELRALRKLFRDSESAYVFTSERGEREGPLTPDAVRKIVQRAGEEATLDFPIHPHMLRHVIGYKLANDGHDTRAIQLYLGHKNIQHTVRYTQLSHARFDNFWRD
jgi:type 1 fimbriae regulatory protein FimB/type 1 fimbriae regulatory protein FimE